MTAGWPWAKLHHHLVTMAGHVNPWAYERADLGLSWNNCTDPHSPLTVSCSLRGNRGLNVLPCPET